MANLITGAVLVLLVLLSAVVLGVWIGLVARVARWVAEPRAESPAAPPSVGLAEGTTFHIPVRDGGPIGLRVSGQSVLSFGQRIGQGEP